MKLQIFDIEGKKKQDIELSDKVFLRKPDMTVLRTVIDWQMNLMKPRKAKTKQRNEISGSTAKIYAQKGTGGARHSSRKAPLFVGGGVAHGPKGSNYKIKKLNKKVKKLGLINALSEKNKEKTLLVIDDFTKKINKTKDFYNFLKKINVSKALLIIDKNSRSNIEKSSRNIPNLKIVNPEGTNVYDLIKYEHAIFTKSSIKLIEQRLSS